MSPARRPLAERFWEKVSKSGPVPPHCPELGPCWVWTRATNESGYGKIGSGDGGDAERTLIASRVAWELINGPVPDHLFVLHRCDNPPCVRPDHLFLGTHEDNMTDMRAKGRQPRPDHAGPRNPRHGAVVSTGTRTLIAAAEAKTVWLRDPSGAPIQITNLTKFCRENGLNQGGMWSVVAGRKRSYKGYTALEHNYRAGLAAGLIDTTPEETP